MKALVSTTLKWAALSCSDDWHARCSRNLLTSKQKVSLETNSEVEKLKYDETERQGQELVSTKNKQCIGLQNIRPKL